MAWLWFVWRSFYVVFILYTLHLDVFASDDVNLNVRDYWEDGTSLEFKLLDDIKSHSIKRRSEPITTESTVTDNRTNQQSSINNTKKAEVPTKNVKKPISSTTVNPNKQLGKNLGENGHGIRKNYTATNNVSVVFETTTVKNVPKNVTEDDELSLSDFSEETDTKLNQTLKKHNILEIKTDSHMYYNSTFVIDASAGNHYWVDMSSNRSDVNINALLSRSHRRAATVKLSFDFPFYGHLIRNITIATGGFIYTGEYVHSWLAATQYIAPLMANFDTSLSNDSYIKYIDNGTAFTVQWDRVSLQDKPKEGEFTFQVTLMNTGDIVFVYKTVPVVIEDILDANHPVKVGLSDAYIIDRTIFFVRRKTIYEYHRVHFSKDDIKNWTVIYLQAQPTCLNNKDCHTCLTNEINNFECTWCPSTNRCSNGLDRHRQDWLMKGCERKQLLNESQCTLDDTVDFAIHDGHEYYYGANKNYDPNDYEHPFHDPNHMNSGQTNHTLDDLNNTGTLSNGRTRHTDGSIISDGSKTSINFSDTIQASRIAHSSRTLDPTDKMSTSSIVSILFLVAIVAGLGAWIMYAYRNPHTTSGQILIRYRPSQWRWRRGEARYTAATIHM